MLLAHVATQAWGWALVPVPEPFTFSSEWILAAAIILSGLLAFAATGRTRLACALALPIVAFEVLWIFPGTPNHVFLSLVLLGVTASFDLEKPEESRLLLQSLRWIAVIIFTWAGVQKVLHGLYFQGEFLGWMVSHGIDRWASLFGWIIPQSEMDRLTALPQFVPGSGPYRVDSIAFIVVSNLVWVGEIALGLAMIFSRTRVWAAIGGIVLVFTIQLAPREFMFAVLYTNLLLLFVPGEPNRRLMLGFLLVYACMIAGLLGAPVSFLMKAGGGI